MKKVKSLEMGTFEVVEKELLTGGTYFRLNETRKNQHVANSKKLKPFLGKRCYVFLVFKGAK